MTNGYWRRLFHYTDKLKLFYDAYNGKLLKVKKLNKLDKKRKYLAYRIKNRIETGEYVNPLGVKSSRPPF